MNLIQAGQQEVNMGSGGLSILLEVRRSMSSFASSMMVRSAVTFILKTFTSPSMRIAWTILLSTCVPGGLPKLSPRVAATDGAVKKTTCLLGSLMAFQTSCVLFLVYSAPTGHTTIH